MAKIFRYINSSDNIISIRNRDVNEANVAFAEFMQMSEDCFNEKSQSNPLLYKNISPSEMEKVTLDILKQVAPSTPFRPEEIKLVAGHTFPDIITEKYFGVEVKCTKENKWTSTGSSIVESTRDEIVENIYMMFGKLGGNPPEFRCRPYQECLSNIAVTHSPRYVIDVSLPKSDNIFSKMNTKYDLFRRLDEKEKISQVRRYYIDKAKREGRYEMPWWMGETTKVNISFYNDLNVIQKEELKTRSLAIFFCQYDSNPQIRYRAISLWLCNHYSLLCPNIRDLFSAGGVCEITLPDGKKKSLPHIAGELLENILKIKKLLDDPDIDLIQDIKEYWDFDFDNNNLFEVWVKEIEKHFNNNTTLKNVPIKSLIEDIVSRHNA
ncbi:MAG: hypothetical protein J5957_00595 [Prevotella sp.]|nr:hypothetical protein [Prevotella sp.]